MTATPGNNATIAVDNDLIIKAACYRLTSTMWRDGSDRTPVAVLGAAPFVTRDAIARAQLAGDRSDAHADAQSFFARAEFLEPSDEELALAADVEAAASLDGLQLDIGESQLAAIVSSRGLGALETGDKRAIVALEALFDGVPAIALLERRIRCLEQVVDLEVSSAPAFGVIAAAVCAEPAVDTTLSICFGCRSRAQPSVAAVREGLESYIRDLRAAAPRILAD